MWRLAQWVRHAVGAAEFDLILTAHSFWYEPKGSDEAYIAPWVQGKAMPERMCGMMNAVGYGTLEEYQVRGNTKQRRVINWDAKDDYYAKCQFKVNGAPVFPEGRTLNPTLPDVWAEIKKGRPVVKGRRPAAANPVRRRRGSKP
jgi:hypothetical protein